MSENDLVSELLAKVHETLEFFDKVKVDKKLKKEREEKVSALKNCMKRCAVKFQTEELYDDVGEQNNSGLTDTFYNDNVVPEQQTYDDNVVVQQTYDDTMPQRTYDDTEVQPTYDDTAAPQLPPPTKEVPPLPAREVPPTECESLIHPRKADFLEIKSGKFSILSGSWSKRWCVLHSGVFYFYETARDKKQKDAFYIQNMTFDFRDDITKETKRKDRCFEIRSEDGKKSYEFCASDKNSALQWQAALNLTPSTIIQRTASTNTLNKDSKAYDDVKQPLPGSKESKKGLFNFGKKKSTKTSSIGDISSNSQDYDDTEVAAQNYDDNVVVGFAPPPPVDDQETYEGYEEDATSPTLPITPQGSRKSNSPLPARPNELAPSPAAFPPSRTPSQSSSRSAGDAPPPLPSRTEPSCGRTSMKDRPAMPLPGEIEQRKMQPIPVIEHELPPPPPADHNVADPTPLPKDDFDWPSAPPEDFLPPPINDFDWPSAPPEDFLPPPINEEEDYKNMYQGMWDCSADDDQELTFKRGEIVHILSREFDEYGWWIASKDGNTGLVPKIYLMEAYEI